jgi:hypothetical protein
VTVLPFIPDGGFRELYDRTAGSQLGREAPFSIWGQEPGLGWLQTGVEVSTVGLALLVGWLPRRKSPRQVAALGAAVLILGQMALAYWFYLYVVWFAPLVLVVVLGAVRAAEVVVTERGGAEQARAEPALA